MPTYHVPVVFNASLSQTQGVQSSHTEYRQRGGHLPPSAPWAGMQVGRNTDKGGQAVLLIRTYNVGLIWGTLMRPTCKKALSLMTACTIERERGFHYVGGPIPPSPPPPRGPSSPRAGFPASTHGRILNCVWCGCGSSMRGLRGWRGEGEGTTSSPANNNNIHDHIAFSRSFPRAIPLRIRRRH